MDEITRTHLINIRSADKVLQNAAYFAILEATDKTVDWAYDIWDEMLAGLTHKDNHVRSICAQVLCNLARSDPKNRMLKDFDKLLIVTKDERFVTARHTLQALWKVGMTGAKQQKKYVDGLAGRFKECIAEKNGTLIRYDICQSMRNVYDVVKDDKIRQTALALIETEADLKYRKKYMNLWRAK